LDAASDPSPIWALALYVLYFLLLFGVQSIMQLQQTGTSGWVEGIGQTRAERLANLLFLVSLVLDLAGPILVLTGSIRPIEAIDVAPLHVVGFVIFGLALLVGVLARQTMGAAWRTGIDPSSSAPLVTQGLFAAARNPVYTTMVSISIAVALLVPNVVAPVAVALRVIALQIQTRLVEEPFLRDRYHRDYTDYAGHVGRFVPLIGRCT